MAPGGRADAAGKHARRASLGDRGAHPPAARVRRRAEFLRIQSRGIRVHSPAFTIVAARGEGTRARLGCAVSRKVGPAVVRNRVRRLVREIFRRSAAGFPPIDFVVIAKPNAAELGRRGLEAVAGEVLPAFSEAVRRLQRAGS